MSNINFQNRDINTSLGSISDIVSNTKKGAEKAMEYISGLHDALILWDSAVEYWQNKSYNFRRNEIEHLKTLGRLSLTEEANLWHELMNERDYGWKNAMVAEENYYKAMYNHSKMWIEEQTRLGNLSADEVAAAWQRVFDKFDNINIKYEAAMKMRDVLLDAADDEVSSRRADSDRWMSRQDIYDGGDPARRIDDLTRRITAEKELLSQIGSGVLNGVTLGVEEQNRRWLECYEYIEDLEDQRYLASKELIEKQAKDYEKAQKEAIDKSYNYRLDLYNKELSEISAKRRQYQNSRKEKDFEEELLELYVLRDRYKYAVTDEGQEKYREYLEKIEKLENEQADYRYNKKLDEEEAKIKDKIDSLKDEYEKTKRDLENTNKTLLENSSLFLSQNVANVKKAESDIGNSLLLINQGFANGVTNLFTACESKVRGLINSINSMVLSGTTSNSYSNDGYFFTYNDYGNKSFDSYESSVFDASDALLEKVRHSLRSAGLK